MEDATCLYADDAALFTGLQKMREFGRVSDRKKLKVNAGELQEIVYERRDCDRLDIGNLYTVIKGNSALNCKIKINIREIMKEVRELEYQLCRTMHGY